MMPRASITLPFSEGLPGCDALRLKDVSSTGCVFIRIRELGNCAWTACSAEMVGVDLENTIAAKSVVNIRPVARFVPADAQEGVPVFLRKVFLDQIYHLAARKSGSV